MRTRTRLATTAGVTVLGFTAMGGVAQADTGGLVSGLTAPLTKTLNGVVKATIATPSTGSSHDSGPSLNLPVHLHVRVPSPARSTSSDGGRWRGEAARSSRGSLASADVDAAVNASPRSLQVRSTVGLCASLAEECGAQPTPPPPPPGPPTPPPPNQPPQAPGSGNEVTASGSVTQVGKSLPFTGGPIGSLAFLGAVSVLTGAAGIAASRIRRES